MSTQVDINSIGDLIASHGTEADRRAWARLKAHIDDLKGAGMTTYWEGRALQNAAELDRLRRELAGARETLNMTDSEQVRRLRSERDEARAKGYRLEVENNRLRAERDGARAERDELREHLGPKFEHVCRLLDPGRQEQQGHPEAEPAL